MVNSFSSESVANVWELDKNIDSFYPSSMVDYYALLSIPSDATQEQILASYRRFNRLTHPITAQDGLSQLFSAAQQAFEVLSDPRLREEYDAYLDYIGKPSKSKRSYPSGDFPVVQLGELSWSPKLSKGRIKKVQQNRIVPGGGPEAHQEAVVNNAVNLLLHIPGTSLFSDVQTPSGELDHVILRKSTVVVVSSLLMPLDNPAADKIQSLIDSTRWLSKKFSKVNPPHINIYVAVLPSSGLRDSTAITRRFKNRVLPSSVEFAVGDAGEDLLKATKPPILSRSYSKVLEGLNK